MYMIMKTFAVAPTRVFSDGDTITLPCIEIKAHNSQRAEEIAKDQAPYGAFDGWKFVAVGEVFNGAKRRFKHFLN